MEGIMAYTMKTVDIYEIQVDYGFGYGFETVCSEDNYKEAKQRLKEYRENERGIFRIKKTREKK